MNPAQGNAQAQPEVADMQQRMRVGTDALFKELMMAGRRSLSGPGDRVARSTSSHRSLPRRVGDVNPDPTIGAAVSQTDASR